MKATARPYRGSTEVTKSLVEDGSVVWSQNTVSPVRSCLIYELLSVDCFFLTLLYEVRSGLATVRL